MTVPKLLRRRVLGRLAAGAALASALPRLSAAAASPLTPTPRQTAGPFYPDRFPDDIDNDLLAIVGRPGMAAGTPLHLSGRVVDTDGRAIRRSVVEIWQCDANGRYHHSTDRPGGRDEGFQGFGRTTVDDDGGYLFRTIHPVPYGSRTPHIHVLVRPPGSEPLVTQMYVAGEPRNQTDGILNRIRDAAARASVIVPLSPDAAAGPDALAARFDIVLGG